ncbi:MAG: hypothetical protein HZA50_02985 [Planctomycetes bacterium]|nr:hypothetical protein [Planctomycetota bacterium]
MKHFSRNCMGFDPLACMAIFVVSLSAAAAPADEPATATSQAGAASCDKAEVLQAGPISVKFQDGQLRYLYAGDREFVRRIYFAVRDARWDTVAPTFSNYKLERGKDSFKISFDAVCKSKTADYAWSGVIEGTADGKITFSAAGKAGAEFNSPRIGLCVLFGAESLAGGEFSVKGSDGRAEACQFPQQIAGKLIADKFNSLEYSVGGVQLKLGLEGGLFSMEDQRAYADSSYKAYAPMEYAYPKIAAGAQAAQKVVLSIKSFEPPLIMTAAQPTTITPGKGVDGAKVPRIVQVEKAFKGSGFHAILNFKGDKDSTKEISWAVNPAWHLSDDDMFMENLPAVLDQARTARAILPNAALKIGPAGIDSPYQRPGPDPRNSAQFAAAWAAGLIKYMALGGTEEATFRIGPGPVNKVLDAFGQYAGWQAISITQTGPLPRTIEACAATSENKTVFWLVNTTSQPQKAILDGLPADSASLSRPGKADDKTQIVNCPKNRLELALEPLDVVFLVFEKK